ncbi:hypothetical protein B4U79_17482 [Dinothrombium tinctorium]|uniref:Uncharacterized protein n=1 Tax=Dinothrombium tinctorium TaxID=1965070 RepID=A0A443RA43_9ACAR|nr:hypothetical protein B4U79_17482 [Dinothrombium tinctorium]
MNNVFTSFHRINVNFSKLIDLFQTQLSEIQNLCIHNCDGINDNNIKLIGIHLRNLKCLSICDLQVTDDGLASLFDVCSNLETLIFSPSDDNFNGSCFQHLPPLKNLALFGWFQLTQPQCELLHRRLSNSLESLGYFNLDCDFENIIKILLNDFSHLKTVKWRISKDWDTLQLLFRCSLGLFCDYLSPEMRGLQQITLLNCPNVTAAEIESLPSFENAKCINFSFAMKVSDLNLSKLLSHFPNMQKLRLRLKGNFKRHHETLYLISKMSNLKELDLEFITYDESEMIIDENLSRIFNAPNLQRIGIACVDQKLAYDLMNMLRLSETRQNVIKIQFYLSLDVYVEVDDFEKIKIEIYKKGDYHYYLWTEQQLAII